MVNSDEELLSLVRVSVGAQNVSQVPTHALRGELVDAKAEITREVAERLQTGDTLDFYQSESSQKALVALMLLRGKAVKDDSNRPRNIGAIRRFDYEDDDERFWRDELVRHINRVTE